MGGIVSALIKAGSKSAREVTDQSAKKSLKKPSGEMKPVQEDFLGQIVSEYSAEVPSKPVGSLTKYSPPPSKPVGKLSKYSPENKREPSTLFIGKGDEQGFKKYVREAPDGVTKIKDVATMYGKENKAYSDNVTLSVGVEDLYKIREYDRNIKNGTTGLRTKEEYESLKESIKKEGIKTPLVVTLKKNEMGDVSAIVGEGNHRIRIARELGITHLPVEIKYR
jgi:hypothetical protein